MGPTHRPKPPLLGEQMSKQRVCWRWPCVTATSGSDHGTVNWACGFHQGLLTTQIGKKDSSNYTSVSPPPAYWDRLRVVNHLEAAPVLLAAAILKCPPLTGRICLGIRRDFHECPLTDPLPASARGRPGSGPVVVGPRDYEARVNRTCD